MFWRGEVVVLSLSASLQAPEEVVVTIQSGGGEPRPVYKGMLTPTDGRAHLSLAMPSDACGSGPYRFTARVHGTEIRRDVRIRESTAISPGMFIDGYFGFIGAKLGPLVKQAGYVNIMGGNQAQKAAAPPADELNNTFDAFMDQGILCWTQDATRPMSFTPPHSSPLTDGEYTRRMVLNNTILMRYPAFSGQVYDYDPTGFIDKAVNLKTYWQWGELRGDLDHYMMVQENALRENFTRQTGMPPFTPKEAMQLAVATGVPEATGYIDTATRRWSQQLTDRGMKVDAQALAELKQRGDVWYRYLMMRNNQRYTAYSRALRALDPTLVHSTANTINHLTPRDGGNHPNSYAPLDFRYVNVWDDQAGNPEHIYETVLAATLLNGGRDAKTPLWIMSHLDSRFFRNTVLLAGRGSSATGNGGEAMGLGQLDDEYKVLARNSPKVQELALSGQFMERFGGVIRKAQRAADVGLLYSDGQIVISPYAQGAVDGTYKLIYCLAQIGLTPELVTEPMLAAGKVPDEMKVLLVARQTETLPEAAQRGLEAFVARGGRVITDTGTTVPWKFAERSAVLDFPFRDLGHPFNAAAPYNRQDATVGVMRDLAAQRCPPLRALLSPLIAQIPFGSTHSDVGVSHLRGGQAAFVSVANNSLLDLSKLFTAEQQKLPVYQSLFVGHEHGTLISWMPLKTTLNLGSNYASSGAIYDLLTQHRVTPVKHAGALQVECDLTGIPARFYALYPAPLGTGKLTATQRVPAGQDIALRYRAADKQGASIKAVVPVSVTLTRADGSAPVTYYRATDARGVLQECVPTGAFDPAGKYQLEVRQLADGQGIGLPLTITAGVPITAYPLAGVSVRDPAAIGSFLASKPILNLPVTDPTLKPLAEKLVAGLGVRGVQVRIWENPTTVDYILGYVVPEAARPDNERVDRGEAIGRVIHRNGKEHVNDNIYTSPLPGYRYGQAVILLGTPGKNPVLDAVRDSGLLWTDVPGAPLVQHLPQALSRGADTLVLTASDIAGLETAVATLLKLPANDPITDGVRLARARRLSGHGLPTSFHEIKADQPLSNTGSKALANADDLDRFITAAVTDVRPWGDRLVVQIDRSGSSLAIVDKRGVVTTVPTPTPGTVALGTDILVTVCGPITYAWDASGRLLWRAAGSFVGILADKDQVVVQSDGKQHLVARDGSETAFTGPVPTAAPPRAKAAGVSLKFRRDVGQQSAEVIRDGAPAAKVTVDTRYLTDAALSLDGQRVIVCGMEGKVVVAGSDGKPIASAKTGRFPRAFPQADSGFVLGTSDGELTFLNAKGKITQTLDLIALTANGPSPDEAYARIRAGKLLSWSNPLVAAGDIPLKAFYHYLRAADATLKLVNQSPDATLDFRWLDAGQASLQFPTRKKYRITVKAAAKYFDGQPMNQPSWDALLAIRDALIVNERPAPSFRIYLNEKEAGQLTPEDGKLKPFVTQRITAGSAGLKPKPADFTTFTGEIEAPAGLQVLGIGAFNMEDCVVNYVCIE